MQEGTGKYSSIKKIPAAIDGTRSKELYCYWTVPLFFCCQNEEPPIIFLIKKWSHVKIIWNTHEHSGPHSAETTDCSILI